MLTLQPSLTWEDSDKSSDSNDDETPARKKKNGGRSLCNVSMGNWDLAKIIYGFPGMVQAWVGHFVTPLKRM